MPLMFILAAVLTASPDPWNQMIFAAPMVVLYLFSIVIAWVVQPEPERPGSPRPNSRDQLRLVVAATMIDRTRRRRNGQLSRQSTRRRPS